MANRERTFISVKEAADYISMSKAFLYDLIKRKKGPPFKRFGRHIRIPFQEFLTWVKKSGD